MKKLNYKIFAILLITLSIVISGCSNRKNISPVPSISDQARAGLKRPVNCNTAERDLKVLEEERASVAKQILSGVRAVFPISAAAGLITGDYNDRVKVATGEYNHALELKIDQIKETCY